MVDQWDHRNKDISMIVTDANSLLERAIGISREAHRGQVDKGGAPYVDHPMRLMNRATSTAAKIVAALHDIVEDSCLTLADLSAEGFPSSIVEAIDHLTRRPNETYEAFIERISLHPLAVEIKLLDLEDNMNVGRLRSVTTDDMKRLKRYSAAHARLKEAVSHQVGNFVDLS